METNNNTELAEKLKALADKHYQHISDVVDSGYDLTSWYRAYMKSVEFEALPPEIKVAAFDAYNGIHKYLNSVFEVIDSYE